MRSEGFDVIDGDTKTRALSPHEIDAATTALTGYLHLKQKTELIGDTIEGYIMFPQKVTGDS